MFIDGLSIDLTGLHILPGLVNAHDHLEFALFPRMGRRTYANATDWANEIHRPYESPIREQLLIPKELRLLWGGLRNLIAGVTLVCHHNPWHPVFEREFPVRVLRRFRWAHSLAFSPNVRERFNALPHGGPFVIHLAEGTDSGCAREIFELHRLGLLGPRTVLVHAVGLDGEGWELVKRSGASVVWCPRSNLFNIGRTLDPSWLGDAGIRFALATDSALTAEGDMLDEIAFAKGSRDWTYGQALHMLRTSPSTGDFVAVREFGAPPELVVVAGRMQLISESLAGARRIVGWSRLHVAGRPPVLVRADIPRLVARTKQALGPGPFRLAGREVFS